MSLLPSSFFFLSGQINGLKRPVLASVSGNRRQKLELLGEERKHRPLLFFFSEGMWVKLPPEIVFHSLKRRPRYSRKLLFQPESLHRCSCSCTAPRSQRRAETHYFVQENGLHRRGHLKKRGEKVRTFCWLETATNGSIRQQALWLLDCNTRGSIFNYSKAKHS